jgi:hypothetical protein
MGEEPAEAISLAEAARRTGHAAVSLRQAAHRGRLAAWQMGEGNRATWYTTPAALAAYLHSRRTWRTAHHTTTARPDAPVPTDHATTATTATDGATAAPGAAS